MLCVYVNEVKADWASVFRQICRLERHVNRPSAKSTLLQGSFFLFVMLHAYSDNLTNVLLCLHQFITYSYKLLLNVNRVIKNRTQ